LKDIAFSIASQDISIAIKDIEFGPLTNNFFSENEIIYLNSDKIVNQSTTK